MTTLLRLGLLLVAVMALRALSAAEFECLLGEKISASLGEGVMLHSCSWEETPGNFVRTGPLQLIRNDILILQLQTDRDGKLQGRYSAWDDAGELTETGHYVDGQKEGEWRSIDANGHVQVVIYRGGIALAP